MPVRYHFYWFPFLWFWWYVYSYEQFHHGPKSRLLFLSQYMLARSHFSVSGRSVISSSLYRLSEFWFLYFSFSEHNFFIHHDSITTSIQQLYSNSTACSFAVLAAHNPYRRRASMVFNQLGGSGRVLCSCMLFYKFTREELWLAYTCNNIRCSDRCDVFPVAFLLSKAADPEGSVALFVGR